MIPEDEYTDLPKDDQLAFLRLEAKYRAKLEANLETEDSDNVLNYFYVEYMNHVVAAASSLELGVLEEWEIPGNQSDIYDAYRRFSNEVAACIVQIRISHSRRDRDLALPLMLKRSERFGIISSRSRSSLASPTW